MEMMFSGVGFRSFNFEFIMRPRSTAEVKVVGNILKNCIKYKIEHFVYASSSSVYGGNTKLPLSEKDPVDHPVSLYAATKRSNELIAHSYSHLFNLPCTGLKRWL